MIPANTQIWLVAGVTDMRRGFSSLGGLVQSTLDKSPLSGQVFIFRGRRGDLVKLIWHDGDGMRAGRANSDRGLSGGSVRPQPKMAGMVRRDKTVLFSGR